MTEVEEKKLLISKTVCEEEVGCLEENSSGHNSLNRESEGGRKKVWSDTNWRQKAIIIYISIVNYLTYLNIGTASPFLARVSLAKGGTVLLSSLVLQVSMLTMALFSFVFAKYQSRIGCKKLIIMGQCVSGLCQIGFGTIGCFENLWAFAAVGAVLRLIQGMCQAALAVSGLTVVCQEFPNFMAFMFGLFEAAYGAGYLSGPYVGGALFDISGGMMIPMAVTGVFSLLVSFIGIGIVQKSYRCEEQSSHSHITFLMMQPKVLLVIGVAGTMMGGFAVCDATITVYLQGKQFSATDVGQLLFLMGVMYTIFALLVGWFINKRTTLRRVLIAIGLVGAIVTPLLLTKNQSTSLIYVATCGFSACCTFVYISSFDELRYILDADIDTSDGDLTLNGALSGVWTAASSMSNFLIPIVASAMESTLSFSVSFLFSILVGWGCTLFAIIIVGFVHLARSKCNLSP